jgi:iron complex outermembrane receptor protein
LTLLLLTPLATFGQDTDTSEPEMEQSEEIVVEDTLPFLPQSNTIATKLPLSLAETPASVGVVTRAMMEEQDSLILGDALRNISGLNVQTGNGVFDFFVVRGLDSVSSGMILTDGAPEPEASFYQLYNLDRVEVLKGPASFLYGGGPLGGAVNLVRKQPLPADFATVSLGAGTQSTLEGTLDWNTSNDDGTLAFRLNAMTRESDGYRDDKASDVTAINPALTWLPNDTTRVNFTLEHVDSTFRSDAGLPLIFGAEVPDVPRTRSYQSPFDISEQEINRAQVDIEKQLSGSGSLRAKLYYRSLDWLSKGTLFNGVFPDMTGSMAVSRYLAELDDKQEFAGGQFEYLRTGTTGSITHNLLAGVEISQLGDEFTFVPKVLPDIDLYNPVETAAEPLFPFPGQSMAADATSKIVAPYLIDQISFSERVQVLLGVRWDNIDFSEDVLGTSRDDDQVDPLVGLVVKATDHLSVYANAGTAFAPPSAFALEADRVPEESEQYELGLKSSTEKAEISLALFDVERTNIAIPDQTGVTRQTGSQTARGVELDLAANLGPGRRLQVAYAFTDGELTEFTEQVLVSFFPPAFATLDHAGNTPAFTPEHLLNVWFSQRFDNGLTAGVGARYLSEQFIAENNQFELDAYWTLDASLSYGRGPWRASLFLKNLTGEEYMTRGFAAASVIPAPTETASARLEYSF